MPWLILLLVSFSLYAQEPKNVSGVLLEKGTRKPLKDVSVFILPHKFKAVTTDKGDFAFENVPVGECTVIINLTGYEKLERKVDCGKIQSQVFYLEKKFYTSFETTVIGKVAKRDDQAHSLTQEEFIKAPGSFGGDPVRAAQNLPGVAATGGSAQIIVQGASPEDTGYLINGHRVPLVFHFGGLSSVIIPEAVERVDLLPSGYGPEYSKAIGGIIGLTTKLPKEDRVHGMAYIDLLNSG
nr:carboxypeptidase-like regulatory domain-containing protein [Bdellovibrionales bacterium]